jgi:hypothetical protein
VQITSLLKLWITPLRLKVAVKGGSTKNWLKSLNLPLLATNDLHYTDHEDAQAHAALALRSIWFHFGRSQSDLNLTTMSFI